MSTPIPPSIETDTVQLPPNSVNEFYEGDEYELAAEGIEATAEGTEAMAEATEEGIEAATTTTTTSPHNESDDNIDSTTKHDGCIQTMSVQDQFASLSHDRDQFRYEREQAKEELTRVQEEYHDVQQELAELVTSNYQTQAELGDHTNTVRMLNEEKARILRLTENEGRALQDCADYTKTLEQKEVDAKKAFIDEMQSMNDEMASILERRTKLKMGEYVTARSVLDVVTTFEMQNDCTLVNIKEPYNELVEVTQAHEEKMFKILEFQEKLRKHREDGVDDAGDVVMELMDDDYHFTADDYDGAVGNFDHAEDCDDAEMDANGADDGANEDIDANAADDGDDANHFDDIAIDNGNEIDTATEMSSVHADEVVQDSEHMDLFYGPQP